MSDNKTIRDGRDNSRVDLHDKSEVEYLHRQHPAYSHQEIVDAIKKYGPMRENIEAHLKR